jgi:hypothetical protein
LSGWLLSWISIGARVQRSLTVAALIGRGHFE